MRDSPNRKVPAILTVITLAGGLYLLGSLFAAQAGPGQLQASTPTPTFMPMRCPFYLGTDWTDYNAANNVDCQGAYGTVANINCYFDHRYPSYQKLPNAWVPTPAPTCPTDNPCTPTPTWLPDFTPSPTPPSGWWWGWGWRCSFPG